MSTENENDYGLTADELAYAEMACMSPREYAGLKQVRNVHDYEALQARLAEDTERERLKQAVREALAERDRGAAA